MSDNILISIDNLKIYSDRCILLDDYKVPPRLFDELANAIWNIPTKKIWKWKNNKKTKEWSIILASPTATGKSTAAAYYLWLHTEGRTDSTRAPRRWWPAYMIYETMTSNSFQQQENKNILLNVPDLVFDDIGSEPLDGYFSAMLYRIVDERSSKYLTTIWTTGYNEANFRKRYNDEKLLRRLIGQGFGEFFEFGG